MARLKRFTLYLLKDGEVTQIHERAKRHNELHFCKEDVDRAIAEGRADYAGVRDEFGNFVYETGYPG